MRNAKLSLLKPGNQVESGSGGYEPHILEKGAPSRDGINMMLGFPALLPFVETGWGFICFTSAWQGFFLLLKYFPYGILWVKGPLVEENLFFPGSWTSSKYYRTRMCFSCWPPSSLGHLAWTPPWCVL